MNDATPTNPADAPAKANEPSSPEQSAPAEAKGALDAAKEKARKAAEGVKELKEKLAKHDLKAELREAFAETKKNPSSLWKKPETLRPGKELAVAGLAAAVTGLLLLFLASGSLLLLVCLALGVGALLLGVLGLKTEGRKLAVGSAVAGLFVVLAAFGLLMEGPEEDEDADLAGYPNGEISLDDYVVTPEEMASNGDNGEDDEDPQAKAVGQFLSGAFDFVTGQDSEESRAFGKTLDAIEEQGPLFGY